MTNDKTELADRRRSERWQCAKEIEWRVRGGRRVRHGVVPERSMDGIVIAAARKDISPVGTRVFPGDDQNGLRHGFRAGVICRMAEIEDRFYLLFIEILA